MGGTGEVGFLGLGQVSGAMAERLLRSGVRLHMHDPSTAAMDRLVPLGAVPHDSPAAVADVVDLVLACLPNDGVSEAVLAGPDSVLAGARVATYVEVSTVGSAAAERIAAPLAARDIGFLDAPISGGPPGARAGVLAVMAARPGISVNGSAA